MDILSKREWRDLLKKLDAEEETDRAGHPRVSIQITETYSIRFGYSRGKRITDGHIPKVLKVSRKDYQALARCNLPKEWYVEQYLTKMKDDIEQRAKEAGGGG